MIEQIKGYKIRVALIRPNYRSHIITPQLGLAYLSACLEKSGHGTVVIDGLKGNLSIDEIVDQACQFGPQLVGITCLTSFYLETIQLTQIFKKKGYTVVLGGLHPSIMAYQTFVDSGCDYIVCGEGEKALVALCDANFNHKKIRGCYKSGDLESKDSPVTFAEVHENLEELPFPDWNKMAPASYPKAPHGAVIKNFPVGVIMTTRGCPYPCTYCASPGFYKRKIRYRSPKNVVDEIELLVRKYGVKEIHFEDDNLTLKRAHIEAICNIILERRIRISWACPNGIRADKVDDSLIKLMRKSGCYYIAFGVESANNSILMNIRKGETIETIDKAINIAADNGIICQGFFIFGLPGETEETMNNSIRFSLQSKLSRAQFLILDVLPGSALWHTLEGEFEPNFAKNSYKEPEWIPEGLTRELLLSYQALAFRRFYFRPAILFSMLRMMKLSQLPFIIRRLRDYRIMDRNTKANHQFPQR